LFLYGFGTEHTISTERGKQMPHICLESITKSGYCPKHTCQKCKINKKLEIPDDQRQTHCFSTECYFDFCEDCSIGLDKMS
jgi:hypothetical protein